MSKPSNNQDIERGRAMRTQTETQARAITASWNDEALLLTCEHVQTVLTTGIGSKTLRLRIPPRDLPLPQFSVRGRTFTARAVAVCHECDHQKIRLSGYAKWGALKALWAGDS